VRLVKIDTVTDKPDFHAISLICCEFSEHRYSETHSSYPCNVIDSSVKIDIVPGMAGFHVVSFICCESCENRYIDKHSRFPCSVIDLL